MGTNSVKLLVAAVHGPQVRPLLERSRQTRLGRGFYEAHRLLPAAIAETAETVARFAAEAVAHGASAVRLIATSAARDAGNREELVEALGRACGLKAEVISGEHEAELVFRGVASDPRHAGRKLLILDVGGGSSEFILGEGGHHAFRQSFALGAVRLLEKLRPGEDSSLEALAACREFLQGFFERHILPLLDPALTHGADLIGTGGTATILARIEHQMTDFDRERLDSAVLPHARLTELTARLWATPLAQRKHIIGLPPNRADIIPLGAAIYEAVVTHYHVARLSVSTRGLRFGALLEPA